MTTFEDIIRQAVSDPGSITPRGDNYTEPIGHWSARAVVEVIQSVFPPDADGGYPVPDALMTHAELRGRLERAAQLLDDAWGIIANAENFKNTLVCEHGSRCQDREGHTIDELTPEPIGSQEWRDAAKSWQDRWHAFMDAERPATIWNDPDNGADAQQAGGVQ